MMQSKMQLTLNTTSAASSLFTLLLVGSGSVEPVISCGDGGEKRQLLTGKEAGQEAPAEALECPGSGSCTNAPDAEE